MKLETAACSRQTGINKPYDVLVEIQKEYGGSCNTADMSSLHSWGPCNERDTKQAFMTKTGQTPRNIWKHRQLCHFSLPNEHS